MSKIARFEDLQAWQVARRLAREMYAVTRTSQFAQDFALRDQMRRAALSVVSHIEGFGREGNREFEQFLGIASGSVSEVKAQLYVALDAGFIDQPQFSTLYELASDAGRLIGGLLRSLRASAYRGSRFREQPELYNPRPASEPPRPTENRELRTEN